MLYQIDGTSARLLGTMHMVPKSQSGWIACAERAYRWSERVVIEMHLSRQQELLALKTVHPLELPMDIDREVRKRWNFDSLGALSDTNLPMIFFVMGSFNTNLDNGVESKLTEWLGGENRLGQLEDAPEFLSAFDNVSAQCFHEAMRWRFPRDAEAKQRLAQLYRSWRGNNVDKMIKIMRMGMPEPIRWAMFDRRNELWAPRIIELAKQSERTLICVGAGHLHGKNNLRDLLAERGLICSRIEP